VNAGNKQKYVSGCLVTAVGRSLVCQLLRRIQQVVFIR